MASATAQPNLQGRQNNNHLEDGTGLSVNFFIIIIIIITMFQMYVGIVRSKPPSKYLVMFNICVLSCLQASANGHLDNKAGHALHLYINLHAAYKCIAVNQARLSVAQVHHTWLIKQL